MTPRECAWATVSAARMRMSTSAGNDMMMLRRKVRTQWKDLLQAFRDVDTDKSGTLNNEELRRVLHRYNIDLGTGQFTELLEAIDEDGDGQISYVRIALSVRASVLAY